MAIFHILLQFYLFWINCNLIILSIVISVCTHPCDTNSFPHKPHKNIFIATENLYPWHLTEVFLKSKLIFFRNKRNFNPKVILFLIKLLIFDSSFLLHSFSKAKIFLNFSTGKSLLFFNRLKCKIFRHMPFYCNSFLAGKKSKQLFSIFLFYHIKISVFDKS